MAHRPASARPTRHSSRLRRREHAARFALPVAGLILAGCEGPQSALDAAGRDAAAVGNLFWVMVVGAVAIWAIVIGIAIAAVLRPPGSARAANALILGGGVAFPVVVLAALLTFGLGLLPDWADSGTRVKIHVTGEQWWWRVTYERADGTTVSDSNEIHMPAGEPVEFVLTADDVIHSFWIPPIGGKMDMIPGRTNRLVLTAEKPGTYRGVCAEFCGTSHALMAFSAIVHEPDGFDAWLEAQQAPAVVADDDGARRGRDLFLGAGCGGCHTMRGVAEMGDVGPDLTHVGSRVTLGAGILPNDQATLAAWIRNPQHLKPGAAMPAYDMLPDADIAAIAAFLAGAR
ncbi:cytochrome c oxidase subunit II [Amorphus sp. MBR-141]